MIKKKKFNNENVEFKMMKFCALSLIFSSEKNKKQENNNSFGNAGMIDQVFFA